jgi:Spy/CpxP family protein refolding chaperone
MKKLIVTTVALLVITIAATAQTKVANQTGGKRKCGNEHKAKVHKAVAKQLDLSDAQKEQMKTVGKAQKEAVKAVKNDASLSDEAKKQKLADLKAQRQASVNTILTDEQEQKLAELKKKAKDRKEKKK